MKEKDTPASIDRRGFIKYIGATAYGAVIGALISRVISQKEIFDLRQQYIDSLSFSNELLIENLAQQEQLVQVLNDMGALRVEIQKAQLETDVISLQATQTALEMTDYRVEATAEAYRENKDSLAEIMSKLPLPLINNSCKISLNLVKKKSEEEIESFICDGSGIITSIDKNENTMICLTCRHLLAWDAESLISGIEISQPHLGEEKIRLSPDSYKIFVDESKDLGIIVINTDRHFFPEHLQEEVAVRENWEPKKGENLFSLCYPGRAESGIGYTPSVFKVVEIKKENQAIQWVFGDSVISGGASGAAVVKTDGSIVGVYTSHGPLGSFVLPVGESYQQLIASAGMG